MKTGKLLEELIEITQKTKTDFALSMHMTSSGLSKILSGSRLPALKEKRTFSRQAADYFAQSIYSHGCYLKLTHLFPVIYDFKSRDDLQWFLTDVIEYYLGRDLDEENGQNPEYSQQGSYFLGRRYSMNILCVVLSHAVRESEGRPLEVYGMLPLHHPVYGEVFEGFIASDPDRFKQVTMNYYLTKGGPDGEDEWSESFWLISKLHRYFALNLWELQAPMKQQFLLIKGELLVIFNEQLDGTPLVLTLRNQSYLNYFCNALLKLDSRKLSYSGGEAAAFLKEHPQFLPTLLERGVDRLYSYLPLGYLLKKEELSSLPGGKELGEEMWSFFHGILSGQTELILSMLGVKQYVVMDRLIVPLIGSISTPGGDALAYMQRLIPLLESQGGLKKVKIIRSDHKNMALLFSKNLSIIYTAGETREQERVHIIQMGVSRGEQERECLMGNVPPVSLSRDLWDAFQGELINR